MIRLLQVAVALLFSWPAYSSTILARSGEHENFSRIVIPMEERTGWEMGRFDAGYVMRFESTDVIIDVSDVYRLIPRTRISNVEFSHQNRTLKLFLNCNCHASAFDYEEGKIVLDVLEGGAPLGSNFENTLQNSVADAEIVNVDPTIQPLVTLREASNSFRDTQIEADESSEAERAKEHAMTLAMKPFRSLDSSASKLLNVLPHTLTEPADTEAASLSNSRMASMEKRLLRQIGRASTQGLLEPNLFERPILPTFPAGEISTIESNDDDPNIVPTAVKNLHVRLSVNTSIDSSVDDAKQLNGTFEKHAQVRECLPSEMFDIESWGDEKTIVSAVSEARIHLSGEFDLTSDRAAEDLVRAYIFASFGREAIQVLNTHGKNLQNREFLMEMATILERGGSFSVPTLSKQLNCKTKGSMWAILAIPKIPIDHDINLPSVKRTFSTLPLHLRRHLGPRLVNSFLELGDRTTAIEIRNAVIRAKGSHGHEFTLVDAKIDLEQGQFVGGVEKLAAIAGGGSEASMNALLELVQNEILRHDKISSSRVETLEAMAFELRATPVESKIISTLVLASVHNHDFQTAVDTVNGAVSRNILTPETINHLQTQILKGATENLDDAEFLEFIYANKELVSTFELPHSQKQYIAKRLVENGLSISPVAILGLQKVMGEKDAMILAQAAINENRPNRAVELTSSYPNTKPAALIRIQAARLLNDYELSASELGKLGDEEGAVRALWRNRDFEAVKRFQNSDFSSAATLANRQLNTSKEKDIIDMRLSTFRRQLNESRDARAIINRLMASLEKPTDG